MSSTLSQKLNDSTNLKFNLDNILKKYNNILLAKTTFNSYCSLSNYPKVYKSNINVPKLTIEDLKKPQNTQEKVFPITDRNNTSSIPKLKKNSINTYIKHNNNKLSSYISVAQKIAGKIFQKQKTDEKSLNSINNKNFDFPLPIATNSKSWKKSNFSSKYKKIESVSPLKKKTLARRENSMNYNLKNTESSLIFHISNIENNTTSTPLYGKPKKISKKSAKLSNIPEDIAKIYSPLKKTKISFCKKIFHDSPFKNCRSDLSKSSHDSYEEEYDVWDNTDLALKGVDLNNSNPAFLNILKMRLQNFPQQKQFLNNKDIVDFARNLVGCEKINKKLLENFNDIQRYDVANNLKKDVNCLKFLNLYYRIRLKDHKTKIHQLFPFEKKIILNPSPKKQFLVKNLRENLENNRYNEVIISKVSEKERKKSDFSNFEKSFGFKF